MSLDKNEDLWMVECVLDSKNVGTGRWVTQQWEWQNINLKPENHSELTMPLELHRDERTDYRFNLNSVQPKLFLALENLDQVRPVALTASQAVAGSYMDGDYLVLSIDMPLPVQAWMEAFIGRHGELLEQRRKKRRGAGRASGN
ncbi:DUF3305 domain-containing protein [Vibrio nigripulchritudo]|uniref:DUF3305 domain-containing protein n=1 Tax=Vibrio nigripulchritudo TaxID=28173 RepID=UPI0005F9BCE9|nr:DUF3305 domain-containing protein [Vibrio nigripulchritudo]KJY76930.1 hypothetical protein TW74_14120 [Vibrio nigripulchritudo]